MRQALGLAALTLLGSAGCIRVHSPQYPSSMRSEAMYELMNGAYRGRVVAVLRDHGRNQIQIDPVSNVFEVTPFLTQRRLIRCIFTPEMLTNGHSMEQGLQRFGTSRVNFSTDDSQLVGAQIHFCMGLMQRVLRTQGVVVPTRPGTRLPVAPIPTEIPAEEDHSPTSGVFSL